MHAGVGEGGGGDRAAWKRPTTNMQQEARAGTREGSGRVGVSVAQLVG